MAGFEVDAAYLRAHAPTVDTLAERTTETAATLEGESLSPPVTGDVRSAVGYQQSVFDWVQTRFEDLTATAHATATVAANLRACADASEASDERAHQRLTALLERLASGSER